MQDKPQRILYNLIRQRLKYIGMKPNYIFHKGKKKKTHKPPQIASFHLCENRKTQAAKEILDSQSDRYDLNIRFPTEFLKHKNEGLSDWSQANEMSNHKILKDVSNTMNEQNIKICKSRSLQRKFTCFKENKEAFRPKSSLKVKDKLKTLHQSSIVSINAQKIDIQPQEYKAREKLKANIKLRNKRNHIEKVEGVSNSYYKILSFMHEKRKNKYQIFSKKEKQNNQKQESSFIKKNSSNKKLVFCLIKRKRYEEEKYQHEKQKIKKMQVAFSNLQENYIKKYKIPIITNQPIYNL